MRVNKHLASVTGMSRRAADQAINQGSVTINGRPAKTGQQVLPGDTVELNKQALGAAPKTTTLILNKPAGYVVSRDGQGSHTIYDLLPQRYHHLKPIGRLDKESSGLLLLTSDGQLAQSLTHPSFQKQKVYEVELDKPLTAAGRLQIEQGIRVEDYTSQMELSEISGRRCTVTLHMGKNRQIRKTFGALGYRVTGLHRIKFGPYQLYRLGPTKFKAC